MDKIDAGVMANGAQNMKYMTVKKKLTMVSEYTLVAAYVFRTLTTTLARDMENFASKQR